MWGKEVKSLSSCVASIFDTQVVGVARRVKAQLQGNTAVAMQHARPRMHVRWRSGGEGLPSCVAEVRGWPRMAPTDAQKVCCLTISASPLRIAQPDRRRLGCMSGHQRRVPPPPGSPTFGGVGLGLLSAKMS